ncbi:hypothetical protein NBRC116493_04020 [Aurantivibrio infirmus]
MKKDAAKVNIGEFNLSSETYFGKLKVKRKGTDLFNGSKKLIFYAVNKINGFIFKKS